MRSNEIRGQRKSGPCLGKIGYLSQKTAQIEAQRLADINAERMSVYRCHICLEWHVGHSRFGQIIPNTPAPAEEPGEWEELVERKSSLESALSMLRHSAIRDTNAKERRLKADLAECELRIVQIKRLRKQGNTIS